MPFWALSKTSLRKYILRHFKSQNFWATFIPMPPTTPNEIILNLFQFWELFYLARLTQSF